MSIIIQFVGFGIGKRFLSGMVSLSGNRGSITFWAFHHHVRYIGQVENLSFSQLDKFIIIFLEFIKDIVNVEVFFGWFTLLAGLAAVDCLMFTVPEQVQAGASASVGVESLCFCCFLAGLLVEE
jgi:hypothetical protein